MTLNIQKPTHADHAMILSYTRRPAFSPSAKFIRNLSAGQSALSFISNLKEPATSFDYMRSVFSKKRKATGDNDSSSSSASAAVTTLDSSSAPVVKARRYNRTDMGDINVSIAPESDPRTSFDAVLHVP